MNLLNFAFILGKLKTLKRTGWIDYGVPNPESVAEHSFRTAILAMVLAPKVGADENKVVRMALMHDVGEAEIGDIVTCKGTKELSNFSEKLVAERKAFRNILSLVEIEDEERIRLFAELEENKTKEARLVNQIDKLEMAIQAYEYEKKYKLNLQDFFDNADAKLVDSELQRIFKEILKLRKK
jgi:putative hydrolases of HD superfamily